MKWIESLCDLLEVWYGRDRIRISPTSGRLLNLNPGNQVLLFEELYQISSKDVSEEDAGIQVCYELSSGSSTKLLVVRSNPRGSEGVLQNKTFERTVFDEDIVVLTD